VLLIRNRIYWENVYLKKQPLERSHTRKDLMETYAVEQKHSGKKNTYQEEFSLKSFPGKISLGKRNLWRNSLSRKNAYKENFH
jgi:hypothetical protein